MSAGNNRRGEPMDQQEKHHSPLTKTKRLDGLLKLSAQLYGQYHDRCTLEWRIHVALWALLAGAGYAMFSNGQGRHFGCKSLWMLLTVPIHLVWCVKIHIGNVKEQDLSTLYREAANKLLEFDPERAVQETPPSKLNERSKIPEWLKKIFKSYLWWLGAEIGTTFLISVVVIFLAW
jgi:hypothetical protein